MKPENSLKHLFSRPTSPEEKSGAICLYNGDIVFPRKRPMAPVFGIGIGVVSGLMIFSSFAALAVIQETCNLSSYLRDKVRGLI